MPERLLVYNLVSSVNQQRLINDINDLIIFEIRRDMEKLKNIISSIDKEGSSIFPNSFTTYAKKIKTDSKKTKDYFIFNCYFLIHSLVSSIEKNYSITDIVIDSKDMDLLNQFIDDFEFLIAEDRGTVSNKQIQRLIHPFGKQYNSIQNKIIAYILQNVIPKIIIDEGKMAYICENYMRILFFYGNPSQQKIFIQGDAKYVEELEERFQKYFYEISKINTEKDIGKKLQKVYQEVKKQYQCNRLGTKFDNYDIQNEVVSNQMKKSSVLYQ